MSAPQDIQAVLAGPHVRTLVHDGSIAIVVAEPLRFIPIVRIGDRDVAMDRRRS